MIAKEINGSSSSGTVAYISKGGEEITRNRISDRANTTAEISNRLDEVANHASSRVKSKYKHFILSFHPQDTENVLGKEEALVREFMEKNGYGNQPYVAFKHDNTNALHFHIATTCIDVQSKKKIYGANGNHFTRLQLQTVAKEMNEKHQFITKKTAPLSKLERVKQALELADKGGYTNLRQLNYRLGDGIEVKKTGNGYSFHLDNTPPLKLKDFADSGHIDKMMIEGKEKRKEHVSSPFGLTRRKQIKEMIITSSKSQNSLESLKNALSDELVFIQHSGGGYEILDKKYNNFYKASELQRGLMDEVKENLATTTEEKINAVFDKFEEAGRKEQEIEKADDLFDKFAEKGKEQQTEQIKDLFDKLDGLGLGGSVNAPQDDQDQTRKKKKKRKGPRR